MAMGSFAENREISADRIPIDSAGSNLVHPLICYTRRRAPTHSCGCPLSPRHALALWSAAVCCCFSSQPRAMKPAWNYVILVLSILPFVDHFVDLVDSDVQVVVQMRRRLV